MPRITPPEVADVPEDVLPVWRAFYGKRGNVPNMFRTLALRPEIMRVLDAAMATIMGEGTVSVRLKELLVVRVSQLNGCRYWLASHSALLRSLGVSQETIDRLPDGGSRDGFSPAEQAALRFAEQLTLDAKRVDDGLWSELRAHFDDAQIVELTAAAGLFNFFNRFNDALQVDITTPGWPGDEPPPR